MFTRVIFSDCKNFFSAQIGRGSGESEIPGNQEASNFNEDITSEHLIILSSQTRTYNRFKLTGREICVKFRQPTHETDEIDAHAWIERIFGNWKILS